LPPQPGLRRPLLPWRGDLLRHGVLPRRMELSKRSMLRGSVVRGDVLRRAGRLLRSGMLSAGESPVLQRATGTLLRAGRPLLWRGVLFRGLDLLRESLLRRRAPLLRRWGDLLRGRAGMLRRAVLPGGLPLLRGSRSLLSAGGNVLQRGLLRRPVLRRDGRMLPGRGKLLQQ